MVCLCVMPATDQRSTLFPYTTLFRSFPERPTEPKKEKILGPRATEVGDSRAPCAERRMRPRSEEHTSELQSHSDLVCRLLLEKKKDTMKDDTHDVSDQTLDLCRLWCR